MGIKHKQSKNTIIEYPSDWEPKTFNQISYMKGRIGWQGLKKSEFTNNPDEPFLITGMNFKGGKIDWETVYHVSYERYEEDEDIQLQNFDVLLTKDGTIGKLLYLEKIPPPGKATLNSHLLLLRPINNQYIPKFIYYVLNSRHFSKFIDYQKSGSTFYGLTQSAMGKYKAVLPPIPEQRAIAEVLSDVDALIEAQEALIEKKRLIKQGVMQELLTGKRRLPGFSGEWAKKSVSEMGIVITGGTPPTKNLEYWGGDVPWITPTDITRSRDIFCSERLITEKGLNYLHELPPDSVLVTCIASIGKNAILRTTGACNQQINAVIPNENNNPEFLYYVFEHNKDYLLSNSGITATRILSKNLFSSLIFNIPYYEEQKAISNILCDLEDEIFGLIEIKNKIRLIKQGMMQELLTGRTRLV